MTRLTIMLGLLAITAPALACDLGSVCWTDLSGGTATTELRFRAQGGERTAVIEAGRSSFRFVEMLTDSPLLPSDWLCVQGRQRNVAGVYSDWFISDKEGVCNQTAAVLPASAPDPVPPQIDSPPVVTPPAVEIFTGLTNRDGLLSFAYKLTECPRGVQQTTSAAKDGQKTITLRCRK